MKLSTRLLLLVALLLGGISVFIYLYFPARLQERVVGSLEREAENLAKMEAFSVAPSLYFEDRETAAEALRGAGERGDTVYVVVEDLQGRVFASLREPLARKAGYRGPPASPLSRGVSVCRAESPILYGGRRLGTTYVGLSLGAMRAEIARSRRTIAVVSALVFLLGLAAVFGIGAFLTAPLKKVADTAEGISKGDWSHRAEVKSKDEVGRLARSFNLMLDHVNAAREQLEALNQDLERRVVERTRELEEEIGERRRGEEALQLANECFRLAGEAVGGAIYDWDIPKACRVWTDGLTRAFGYPLEEVPATTEWWVSRIHPDDVARVQEQLREDLEVGRDFVAEYRFRGRDQQYLVVWDRGRVLRDGTGRTIRMVGAMENVTRMKQFEAEFRQAQKMEAVGKLAGGIAHDFNNLLTTILGYSSLLLQGMPQDSADRIEVEEILKAGERASALTQQLLAFSRKQVIAPKILEVNAAVGNMERMLRRLIGEDIVLETDLEASAGRIKADPGQIEQVVLNIAVNARDAMPRGGRLVLQTSGVVVPEDYFREQVRVRLGRYTSLVMRDNGCGMDEATRSRIFEPFFTTKAPSGGTGLGMATVYGIVKQNRGYVWVESQPGAGTTVTILLPQTKESASPEPAEVPLPPSEGNETVLLVEDEEAVRSLLCGVLRSQGYTVLAAQDAAEALQAAEQFPSPIHLLLTDLVMPGRGGRELADELVRRRPETSVMYMSGYTEDGNVLRGAPPGAAFLQKPFSPTVLLQKLRETLDGAHSSN